MQPLEQSSASQKYLIKGTLNGEFSDSIKIRYRSKVDTREIINNTFQFEGEVSSPTAFQFVFDSVNSSETFYLENDTLVFDIILDKVQVDQDTLKTYEIKQLNSNSASKIKTDFKSFLKKTPRSKLNRALVSNKIDSLIKAHPNHDYLGQLLLQVSINQDLLYNDVRSLLSQLDKNELRSQDVELLEAYQQKRKNFQIGSKINDYQLLNITSDLVDLKSNFKKYNLLVFWNSWCESCKSEQRQIKTIYENYNFRGFEVISISLDPNQQDWITSVAELSMPWPALRAEKGFTAPIATEMGIVDLPQYYLVDERGRILEINLSTEELRTILNALLN
jgi:peroxiredoxin